MRCLGFSRKHVFIVSFRTKALNVLSLETVFCKQKFVVFQRVCIYFKQLLKIY
jgi:hypothetical protein